jgi:signal transduction histidine kinase
MSLLKPLVYAGVNFAKSPSQRRNILLSNLVSLVLVLLGAILFGAYYFWYGWGIVAMSIPVVVSLCLLTIPLNKYNLSKISRLWLCLLVPASAMVVSIYSKHLYYDIQEELDYFSFRFIILASCVFPAIFFSFKEKGYLISASLIGLFILILHDPLHEAFGVGYAKDSLIERNYYFTNVVVLITYAIMVGAVLFLRKVSENNEDRSYKLIHELNTKNDELIEKNAEIEAQHSEILAQTENLNQSQNRLQEAYTLIEEQKALLLKLNKHLSSELLEINQDLTDTNNELIKHNNELRQFSYTVSHNLRGPVASLGGLIELIDSKNMSSESVEIHNHIRTSIQKLETVIKDLNQIIDIRNEIFHIRKKVNLPSEVRDILDGLKKEIDQHGIIVRTHFSSADIYSVKPMVHSILYNLISNAIKYRAPDRRSEIVVSARIENDFIVLEVRDNGLGIDLKNHQHNLFKLYKRFHFHTAGKGLGLYLVKLQAEALGGKVEVESEINKYTKFTVYLSEPDNIQQQVLYDSAYARIYYDATINCTGVVWNGPVSSEQYRGVFLKCLEFVKTYSTPNYVADLTNQGYINRDDQMWMFQNIMPDAATYGLRKIAAISPDRSDPKVKEYLNGISYTLNKLGIEQEFFISHEEAISWIQYQNEKSSLNF